jgi:cell wall-associated NlpC family hydrolase
VIYYLGISFFGDQSETGISQSIESKTVTLGDSLIAFAKTLEGRTYKAGGCTDAEGFDCSGLVKYTFNAFDLEVGRSSRELAKAGHSVPVGEGLPGDIVVFARTKGKQARVFHSGLLISSNQDSLVIIHATQSKGVHITNISVSRYWEPKLYDVRRIERLSRAQQFRNKIYHSKFISMNFKLT